MANRAEITSFALEQERDGQHRVPPRGQVKEDTDCSMPGKRRRATAGGRHTMNGGKARSRR